MVDKLTNHQISDLRETFSLIDRDGDGFITSKDLEKVMRSAGQNPTEAEVQDMINGVDAYGNGQIDFPVFLNWRASMMIPADPEEKGLEETFLVLDEDEDGLISEADLRSLLTKLGVELTDEEVNEMLCEGDVDGDGQINYEDFARFMTLSENRSTHD